MQTDYMICKLAAERCQKNLAHICALVHMKEEGALNSEAAAARIKDNMLVLIDALNCDIETIDDVIGMMASYERQESPLRISAV